MTTPVEKETFWQLSSPLTFAATAFCRAKCRLPDSSSSDGVRDTREGEVVSTIATAAMVGSVMAILGSNRWNTNVSRRWRQRRTIWLEMKSTIRILFLEMITDYNVKRTFDDVMMICKITEDDHTNDHHH